MKKELNSKFGALQGQQGFVVSYEDARPPSLILFWATLLASPFAICALYLWTGLSRLRSRD